MTKIIIDAENAARGRVASYAAKEALKGNDIIVLNSEKALVSGNASSSIGRFKFLRALNSIKPEKGPFLSKDPEKIMKRAIRGMVPDFRRGRGKEAIKKIKCYVGIPEEFKKEKAIKINANAPRKGITIKELSERA